MRDKAEVISSICCALSVGDMGAASSIAFLEYSWQSQPRHRRAYTPYQATQIYLRDGFIDRYFGNRLVFPGALHMISRLMPVEFPAHPNWKMDKSHIMYWELYPTIDHVDPIARGGKDEPDNWVSVSMIHNAAKDHWTIKELGWQLVDPGDFNEWDGQIHWFLQTMEANLPAYQGSPSLNRWYSAAKRALKR